MVNWRTGSVDWVVLLVWACAAIVCAGTWTFVLWLCGVGRH